MNSKARRLTVIVGIGLGLMLQLTTAFADTRAFNELSGEWWQWSSSIPASENPLLDATGEKCVVGQHGSLWFLAGNFGGTTTRSCSVPAGKDLFFPVINSIQADTPNVCGQGSANITIKELRAIAASFIDGASNLSVEVDGAPIKYRRTQSKVFELSVPAGNMFDVPCGGFPAEIYSPAIDDGYYVLLNPLSVGEHTIHIHSENVSASFVLDVTYHLTVVPVILK